MEELKEIIIKTISKNNNLKRYKDDKKITSICIRILNEFVTYGFCNLDENNNILGVDINNSSNFKLLDLIESIIFMNDKKLIENHLVESIQSIDYIGQCWFYPKEISIIIFKETQKRHNYKKIKKILNELVKNNNCLKITNKKRQSMYRVLFTS